MPQTFIYRAGGLMFFYLPEIYNGDVSPLYPYLINTVMDLTDCPSEVIYDKMIHGDWFSGECNTGMERYQVPDKVFDLLVDTAALHVAIKNPKPFTDILLYTYIWRLIGFIIFMITRDDRVFIFFPHLFQVFYIYYYAVDEFDIDVETTNIQNLILLTIGKLTHELALHSNKKA